MNNVKKASALFEKVGFSPKKDIHLCPAQG